MLQDKILVLDFGSQYTQLIARRVRENSVYSEIFPYNAPFEKILDFKPKGIILSGGRFKRLQQGFPNPRYKDIWPWHSDYRHMLRHAAYGSFARGRVAKAAKGEYGRAELSLTTIRICLKERSTPNAQRQTVVWMSHGDRIEKYPEDFMPIAHTENSPGGSG